MLVNGPFDHAAAVSASRFQRLRESVRVVALSDAAISREADWLAWQDYWDAKTEEYDALMKGRLARKVPKKILDDSKYIADFAAVVGDLLAAFADTVHYRGVDDIRTLKF